jgi:hypothetical protein
MNRRFAVTGCDRRIVDRAQDIAIEPQDSTNGSIRRTLIIHASATSITDRRQRIYSSKNSAQIISLYPERHDANDAGNDPVFHKGLRNVLILQAIATAFLVIMLLTSGAG